MCCYSCLTLWTKYLGISANQRQRWLMAEVTGTISALHAFQDAWQICPPEIASKEQSGHPSASLTAFTWTSGSLMRL